MWIKSTSFNQWVISYPYVERYKFYTALNFGELLNLRALRFKNAYASLNPPPPPPPLQSPPQSPPHNPTLLLLGNKGIIHSQSNMLITFAIFCISFALFRDIRNQHINLRVKMKPTFNCCIIGCLNDIWRERVEFKSSWNDLMSYPPHLFMYFYHHFHSLSFTSLWL